jgi:hypothetical protein
MGIITMIVKKINRTQTGALNIKKKIFSTDTIGGKDKMAINHLFSRSTIGLFLIRKFKIFIIENSNAIVFSS